MDPRYSKVRGQLLWVIVHGSVKISAPLTVDGNAARTALNCFWVDDAKPGTKPLAGVAQGAKWVPFLCSGNILSGQSWAERAMISF